jgi:hypothetical protein
MAKKNTEITPDLPVDVYLMEVVGPTMTTIQDDLHELKEKIKSMEGHPTSGLSSSENDDLAETIADKVVSKMPTQQITQAEQKKEGDPDSASNLLNAAKEGVRKEITPMVQSFGSVKTRLDTAISSIENLTKKFDEYVKTNQIVAVSRIKRYLHLVLPAVTALAAFLLSWGAYHNSYHYWGERFHKLTNDPMQTEQPLLDLKYNSIEMIKIEFEGGRKQKAKETIKKAESRLRKHKRAVKKTERKRKRQARKAGGADHAE